MNEEFKGSNLFLNIPVHVAYDEEVLKKPKAALLYGEINSMLNVTGKFYMSNNTIAKRLNVSRSTAIRYVNLLKERGFIETENVIDEMTGAIKGRYISLPSNNNDTRVVAQEKLGWSRGRYEGSSTDYTQKEQLNKTLKYNNNNNTFVLDDDKKRVHEKARHLFNVTELVSQDLEYDLQEHNAELLLYAMEVTARSAERITYNYYKAILSNWDKRGFKTVDDVKQYEAERANKKKQYKPSKTINTDDDNVGLNW